ncbi:molybdate ABC transporter substrate-binding protein [Rhodopila sp.]|uniref:molybdate ABC transporter substrate-binding protein n=1 Tax=Rhodopila sp. TaxID=2480087 RepID=UPI003D0F50B7
MLLPRRVLIAGLPLIAAGASRAEVPPVQVYAATTLRSALDPVLAACRDTGAAAVGIYAPTPVLVRQLAAGAIADILLTADPDWMDEADRQALIQPATRSNLLSNDLVLAGPVGIPVAGTITESFPLEALLDGERLAMCDPDHDPAGRYAKQSLQALGFWRMVAPRIAVAESSLAAVTLVDLGEARAAICFKTDMHGADHAAIVGIFSSRTHAPIVYPVALTHNTRAPSAADVLRFLRTSDALTIFTRFGYQPTT